MNGLISVRHHKWVSHDQMPIVARFENPDLRSASSGCDTTKIQLFCPHFLHNVVMHWTTKQISPMTVLVQNGYLLLHKLMSYPLIFTKFPFRHPICTMLFVIAIAVCLFQANCSLFLSTCAYGNDYFFCKPLQG